MSRQALILRRRVLARLAATPALAGLMGASGRLTDRAPKTLPFLLVAPFESTDLSAGGSNGEEHLVAVEAWTGLDQSGRGAEIAAQIREALTGLPADPPGVTVVSGPDHLWTRARRLPLQRALVTAVTFRTVTEAP